MFTAFCFVISPMTLARRVFKTKDAHSVYGLLLLLHLLACSGALNLSLTNAKQETVFSIVGAASADQFEPQLRRIVQLVPIPASAFCG